VSLSKVERPKGGTNKKKKEDTHKCKDIINAITEAYDKELTRRKDQKKKVMGGFGEVH
jgi:hypothetical protein